MPSKWLIYVDSDYGSDNADGSSSDPYQTLSHALEKAYPGSIIILNPGSYGDIEITKNLMVKSVGDELPVLGRLTISGAQVLLEKLEFNGSSSGVTVSNSRYGSFSVRDCLFNECDHPVVVESANYVSLCRNAFKVYRTAVSIKNAREACLIANVFYTGDKAVNISNTVLTDLQRNTLFMSTPETSSSVYTEDLSDSDKNLRVLFFTLTSVDIDYKRISLPGYACSTSGGGYDVALSIINGSSSFDYGVDYTVSGYGSIVTWDNLDLDGMLQAGDVLCVRYSEAGSGVNTDSAAIQLLNIGNSDSGVGSNSITGETLGSGQGSIGVGVFYTTPVNLRYNNFHHVVNWWDGAVSPAGSTGIGNISADPQYRDTAVGDLRIDDTSPNVDAADPERQQRLNDDLGIGVVEGGYTGIGSASREGVADCGRNRDPSGFINAAIEDQSIGAYEYNPNESSSGEYVEEGGMDMNNPGTELLPYASIERGFSRSSGDVAVGTDDVPVQNGSTLESGGVYYGRYRSGKISLSSGSLVPGDGSGKDLVCVYPLHASVSSGSVYVSPDGNDEWEGTEDRPFRDIQKAVDSGADSIVVLPGVYPSFSGREGVDLSGMERVYTVDTGRYRHSDMRTGNWSGSGGYRIGPKRIVLDGSATLESDFSFSGSVELKSYVKTGGCTEILLKSDDAGIGVRIEGNSIKSIRKESGALYTVRGSSFVSGEKVFVHIQTDSENFYIKYSWSEGKGSFSGAFESHDSSPWKISVDNSSGITNVNDMYIEADGVTGIPEVSCDVLVKKAFVIYSKTP